MILLNVFEYYKTKCLMVFIHMLQGLTERFKEKDTSFSGSAMFTYETFMLTVLPFLIA